VIDIHHHCLPGVDDGPREWDGAVAMCAMAADEGIEAIIATPHVLRGRWRTAPREELESRLSNLAEKSNGAPRLYLGSEYFFAHDVNEVLESGEGIIPLAGSRYVLVELASNSVPPMIEQPLYRMQLSSWTPIIAHPERNLVLQSKPEILTALVEMGVRTQVTLGSLTGDFGTEARKAAHMMLERGLVHFVATDAHNTDKRAPRLREPLRILRELMDESAVEGLTRGNPLAVLEGRPLEWVPEPQPPQNHGFLSRLRSFFGSQA
jgi:protein-tyrosine phosphatase